MAEEAMEVPNTAEEIMEVPVKETVDDHPEATTSELQPPKEGTEEAKEPLGSSEELNKTPTKTDESGKKVYTEQERLQRKEYFKQLREKRRLARERHNKPRQNPGRKHPLSPRASDLDIPGPKDILISFNMTEEDKKMLDFYKLRLSTLKFENEQLHRRLASLVRENMRFLQMGPPLKAL